MNEEFRWKSKSENDNQRKTKRFRLSKSEKRVEKYRQAIKDAEHKILLEELKPDKNINRINSLQQNIKKLEHKILCNINQRNNLNTNGLSKSTGKYGYNTYKSSSMKPYSGGRCSGK